MTYCFKVSIVFLVITISCSGGLLSLNDRSPPCATNFNFINMNRICTYKRFSDNNIGQVGGGY